MKSVISKIAVIGQGYVGLPLSLTAAEVGFQVVGVDSNSSKVERINSGISDIEDVSQIRLQKVLDSGNFKASSDYSCVSSANVILVCVPTPLNVLHLPDLSFLISAVESVSKYLSKEAVLIIESTVAPGTTRDVLVPIIREKSKNFDREINIVFSPERVDPTNSRWNIKNTPKLLSGINEYSTSIAIEFYSNFIDTIIDVKSIEVAEIAKLLENSFRLVNISFINEFSTLCTKLGIKIEEVIEAASTKPYGFMPFYPSVGVGGHCIPVDPIYLAEKAKNVGINLKMIEVAHQINLAMPMHFVRRVEEKLGQLKRKRILVIGIAYKPNVADVRETPAEDLITGLKEKGAEVFWHDDLVKMWNGEKSVALSNKYDLAILATPHDYLDLTKLGDVPIINTRGSI
jgi:UDP-N-acetyl-D-glucosamine dehydrogenase